VDEAGLGRRTLSHDSLRFREHAPAPHLPLQVVPSLSTRFVARLTRGRQAWQRWPPWAKAVVIVAVLLLIGAIANAANNSSSNRRVATPVPATRAEELAPPDTLPTTTTQAADEEGTIDPTAASAQPPTSAAPPPAPANACRADPLANVYHPARLRIVQACATVTGTVMSVRPEDDGDVHFDLSVDSTLVNAANISRQHGWLVIEVVPADEPGCIPGQSPRPASGTYDYGICTGANVTTPTIGQEVTVTGPYVLDSAHGWMEIHPAWAISTGTGGATQRPALAPTPTPANAPKPSTNVVHPGAFCSPQGAHGVTSAGTPMICTTSLTDPRARWRAG